MPIVGTLQYPSIEEVTDLVRSIVQDDMAGAGTIGSGQIFVDDTTVSVTLQRFFNSAVREVQRALRIVNSPTFIRDNYILLSVPPVNGPLGPSAPDPTIQQALTYTGFFDGNQIWPNLTLPADMYEPLVLWERISGSGNPFSQMTQPAQALQGYLQGASWNEWEWRADQIWLHGALQPNDMRIRYYSKITNPWQVGVDVALTFINIQDSTEAIAYKIAEKIGMRQGSQMFPAVAQKAKDEINLLILEQSKRSQGYDYFTRSFGNDDPVVS